MHQKTQPAAMRPDEAHTLIGGPEKISRRAFYNAINRNEIPHIRLGRRILIPRAAFENFLQASGFVPKVNV